MTTHTNTVVSTYCHPHTGWSVLNVTHIQGGQYRLPPTHRGSVQTAAHTVVNCTFVEESYNISPVPLDT